MLSILMPPAFTLALGTKQIYLNFLHGHLQNGHTYIAPINGVVCLKY